MSHSDTSETADRTTRHLALVAGVALAVLAVDQLSKWWALETLDDQVIDVVWTLRFNLTFNRGAAFSMGGGGGFGPLIGVLAVGVVVLLLYAGRQFRTKPAAVALGLVLGGAVGNLCDRAFRGEGFMQGAVIDFIDVQFWPVWNVADMGVVVGGVMLAFIGMRHDPA